MIVEKIMSKSVVTIGMDDSLRKVKDIFERKRFHHLIVIEDDKVFGVISDRDLLKSISQNIGTINETACDAESLKKRVHQVMTRELTTLQPGADIDDAIDIFNKVHVSCIPVVDHENKPVGIISWRDILKAIEIKRDTPPYRPNFQGPS